MSDPQWQCDEHGNGWGTPTCPFCEEIAGRANHEPRPRPITKEEEAVIEAAKKWAAVYRRSSADGPDRYEENAHRERLNLDTAVRALTAPEAVRPSEVEPGTRFRFFADSPESQTRIVLANVNGVRMYLNPVTFHAYYFTESERIIPVED